MGHEITYEFVPLSEKLKERPVTFVLRELTWRDMVALEDMITLGKDGTPTLKAGSMKAERFLRALVGWKNFSLNGSGDLPYSAENRELVPIHFYNAIIEEVNRRSVLTEADERD